MWRTIVNVVVLCGLAVTVCNALSAGPLYILEKSGYIVNMDSNLSECSAVKCVSGVNCSEDSAMKCSKFTYCAEFEVNVSSEDTGSTHLVVMEECITGVPLGKECKHDSDCIDYWSGAYCSLETHLCTRARVLNESCNANVSCVFPLECEAGFCVNNYAFTVGEPCDTSKKNGGCHLSLYCSSVTHLCEDLPVLDEPCNDEVGCALPYFCSPTDNVCVEPMSRSEGESCVTSLDCNYTLICARNRTCVLPIENYTDAVNCSSNADCDEASYCHCDYVTGVSMCLPLPVSSQANLELFEALLSCVGLDPDMSVARCQNELVDVQRAINASAIIDLECSRLPSFNNSIDLLLLLVPVSILVVILCLVLIVKLGIPKDK